MTFEQFEGPIVKNSYRILAGGTVGGNIILYTKKVAGSIPSQGTNLGGGFDPWSGCVREATE